jgi:hypothetical protein
MTDAVTDLPTDRLRNTLEEMRASAAAGADGGLRGLLHEMILGFVSLLMALLADFRAGKLAPVAPIPGDACPAPRAADAGGAASGEVAAGALPDARGAAADGWFGRWGRWGKKAVRAQNGGVVSNREHA